MLIKFVGVQDDCSCPLIEGETKTGLVTKMIVINMYVQSKGKRIIRITKISSIIRNTFPLKDALNRIFLVNFQNNKR